VDIRNTTLGPKHHDTTLAMSNLADSYFNQKKWDEAMKLYFDVFEARKVKLGQNHPMTLDSMGMLGSAYIYCGRVNEGQSLLSKAAILLEKTIGPEHPITTTFWQRKESLAYIYVP